MTACVMILVCNSILLQLSSNKTLIRFIYGCVIKTQSGGLTIPKIGISAVMKMWIFCCAIGVWGAVLNQFSQFLQ